MKPTAFSFSLLGPTGKMECDGVLEPGVREPLMRFMAAVASGDVTADQLERIMLFVNFKTALGKDK